LRIANVSGRLSLVTTDRALDVESASDGRFAADPAAVFARWPEFYGWARDVDVAGHEEAVPFTVDTLGPPSPRPRQVIGIGLNYADHAAESGLPVPEHPVVFTKFASSVAGADVEVVLPGDTVDWEAELVVVIGVGGRDIAPDSAFAAIAGYTVGQDLSERTVQWQGQPAQFSMGKSFAGFAPTGPVIVTTDALADPNRLRLTTTIVAVDGTHTRVQDGSTDQLIFSVADLVSRLSHTLELLPGDLIFTGTPPGVGAGMDPKRFLASGETLVTEIEGIGRITQRFIR
jgi:2,4-didehydro-3-deoxy-L-rhamnonate hydrolase